MQEKEYYTKNKQLQFISVLLTVLIFEKAYLHKSCGVVLGTGRLLCNTFLNKKLDALFNHNLKHPMLIQSQSHSFIHILR